MRHAWVAFALLGCSSEMVPPADVALYVGQESNAWLDSPQATRIQVALLQLDGSRAVLVDTAAPTPFTAGETSAAIVTLPEQVYNGPMIASFEAIASEANGTPVLRGESIFYQMTSLFAVRIPIFLGRVGSWARPPSPLEHAHLRPVVSTIYELVIAAGGEPVPGLDPAVPDLYDTAVWQTVRNQPPLPRAPKSMASIGTMLLALDGSGAAWVDMASGTTQSLAAVTGLDFADVAGGDTIEVPDGPRYIVGGTRQDGPATDKVLRIEASTSSSAPALTPSALTLTTPRRGAAAAMVGTSLIVVGGTATGAMAEVLRAGESSFFSLALPADPTMGLGIAALDEKTVIVAGGVDPATGAAPAVRTFDITCTASCATTALAALSMQLSRTRVYVTTPTRVLVVGEGDDGANHALLLDTSISPPGLTEITLKEPRAKATPALFPNGQVGFVGGVHLDGTASDATNIEIFIP